MVDLHVSTILYRVIIYMCPSLFLNLADSYFLDHLKEGVSMQHKKQNWKIQRIAIQKISKKVFAFVSDIFNPIKHFSCLAKHPLKYTTAQFLSLSLNISELV